MGITAGMRGAFAVLELTFPAPIGCDFTVTAPAVTLEFVWPTPHSKTIRLEAGDPRVTWKEVSPTSATARVKLNGDEIDDTKSITVAARIGVGADVIDYLSQTVPVAKNTRID